MRPASEAGFNGRVSTRGPEHWLLLAAAAVALAGFVTFGVFVEPDPSGHGTHERLGLPPCLTMKVLDVPCPGCGVTTSVALASRGRFVDAFLNQPFGLFTALVGALLIPWALWGHFTGRNLATEFGRIANRRTVGVVLSFAAAAWIWKLYLELGG